MAKNENGRNATGGLVLEFLKELDEILGKYGFCYKCFKKEQVQEEIQNNYKSLEKDDPLYYRTKFEWIENMINYHGTIQVKNQLKFKKKMGLTQRESDIQYQFKDLYYLYGVQGERVREVHGDFIPLMFQEYDVTMEFVFKKNFDSWIKQTYPEYEIKQLFDEEKTKKWLVNKINDDKFNISSKINCTKGILELRKEFNDFYDRSLIKQ